jgi:hypothetical protein
VVSQMPMMEKPAVPAIQMITVRLIEWPALPYKNAAVGLAVFRGHCGSLWATSASLSSSSRDVTRVAFLWEAMKERRRGKVRPVLADYCADRAICTWVPWGIGNLFTLGPACCGVSEPAGTPQGCLEWLDSS